MDYLNQLREGIFEAYTGIIQGLRSDNAADPHLINFVNNIVNFVGFAYADPTKSDSVVRGAIGVLGYATIYTLYIIYIALLFQSFCLFVLY